MNLEFLRQISSTIIIIDDEDDCWIEDGEDE